MAKKVIKEIIIMLLLCLAIILLLGILLYDYVPMTKTIPNPVSYTTPDSVKKELANTAGIDESQIIMTYEVDSTDLNNYKRTEDYKPGKANPFSSYEVTQNTVGTNTTAGKSSTGSNGKNNNTTNTNTTNKNNTTNTNNTSEKTQENTTTSGGQFFQDKGTK